MHPQHCDMLANHDINMALECNGIYRRFYPMTMKRSPHHRSLHCPILFSDLFHGIQSIAESSVLLWSPYSHNDFRDCCRRSCWGRMAGLVLLFARRLSLAMQAMGQRARNEMGRRVKAISVGYIAFSEGHSIKTPYGN